ncbi:MAG: VanW family protein [Eubacterium sp.]|nr:VanW family protein [Eubacterium sp.]
MRKPKFGRAILVLIIMFFAIIIYMMVAYKMVKPDDDKITQGVSIENVDVSGMTRGQAQEAIGQLMDKLSARTLEVDVNGDKVSTTMAEIGYACVTGPAIDQAMSVGKTESALSNYSELKRVEREGQNFDLEFTYSEDSLSKFVKKKCGSKCTKAKNSKIKMKNGKLVYTDAKQGVQIDVDQTTQDIKKALKDQEDQSIVQVTAKVEVSEPTVTKELAQRCKDKLGDYTTSFNAGNISRSKNVSNAASLINGTVVYPGKTFSVHDAISPMTEENGYYAAPSYNNGQVVESIGGGVCQVSSTLYNALLEAELEIVQRNPHSMMVTYVEPSRDAAIAGDYKDLKFKNNTDVPIYIQAGTYSGNVYFNIYGEETRSSDRTVTFQSETLETIQPGKDKVTYDKTQPESYFVVTQEAHTGYKAVLWKIVTQNGKTKKTQVNASTYKAEPRYVTKGAAKATATPKATEEAKTTAKPTSAPKATQAPAATAAPTAAPEAEESQTTETN